MTPTIDKHFFAEGERIVQASIATDPVTGDPHLAERSMSRQKALDMLCDLLEALAPTGNTPGNATEGQCATKRLIANVRQRWEELGYNGQALPKAAHLAAFGNAGLGHVLLGIWEFR